VTSERKNDTSQVMTNESKGEVAETRGARSFQRDRTKAGGYRDLLVWQKGIALVKTIYEITRAFPDEERFGLISQMRRAAISIPSNIAEGQARKTTAEFVHFLSTAEGSLAELDTQLTVSVELGYCNRPGVTGANELISELKKMLNALRRALVKTG
jgi:four helix bundle protein